MDLVVAVGSHNAGKSTLIRALTGVGRNWNDHVARGAWNIYELEWATGRDKTLVVISSLNEGNDHARYRSGDWRLPGTNLVSANDLADFLDHYQAQGANRAILPISLAVPHQGFTANDFAGVINTGMVGTHVVQDVCALRQSGPFQVSPQRRIQNAAQAQNSTSAQVRAMIGLI